MASPSRRRTALVAGLCACLGLALLVAAPGAAAQAPSAPGAAAGPSDSWGQPGYDTRRRSFNPGEKTIGAGNVASLQVAWTMPVLGLWRATAVADGRLFRIDNGRVDAVATADGSTLWSYGDDDGECPSWNPRSLIASATQVFAYFDDGCSVSAGSDFARVAALDASTGSLLWDTGPSQWVWKLGLVDGHLIVGTEDEGYGYGFKVYDAATGTFEWAKYETNHTVIAADSTRVYFTGYDWSTGLDYTAALKLDDGSTVWSRTMWPGSSLVIGDGALYVNGTNPVRGKSVVRVLDPASGAWRFRIKDASVLAYKPGRLFTASTDRGTLTARRSDNGKVIWSRTSATTDAGGVMLANGLAYVLWSGPYSSVLRVYRISDGTRLVKLTKYTGLSGVTGGTLYATTGDSLVALRPQ